MGEQVPVAWYPIRRRVALLPYAPLVAGENQLFYGDNLDVLRLHVKDESVDLVYLDPPFNSNQDYNVLFAEQDGSRAAAQIKAFGDTWRWDQAAARAYEETVELGGTVSLVMQAFRTFLGGADLRGSDMLAYLSMMAPRLMELRRVLRPTGSIYLHCDPTASHYLKMLMDAVFGPTNFLNEIIWRRTGAHSTPRRFETIHDVIFFYRKTSQGYFRPLKRPYSKAHVKSRYTLGPDGKYKFGTGGNILSGPGITQEGDSGRPWRGFDPTQKMRHWAIPGYLAEQMPSEFAALTATEKLEALYQAGLVEIKEGAEWPHPVKYLGPDDGIFAPDLWAYQPGTDGVLYGTDEGIDADVQWLAPRDPERLGYQTQKPIGLLERIIGTSCPIGGVVLDPFCGCGTTIEAAQKLGCQWIGIDITHLAVTLMKHRLHDAFGDEAKFKVVGEPTTVDGAEQLATDDPYQFQWWALGLVGARPAEQKKGADRGIDGRLYFHDEGPGGKTKQIVLSVKAGHNVSVAMVRDLGHVRSREGAAIGVLLTMTEPTGPMKREAAGEGFYESPWNGEKYPRLQIRTVGELLAGKGIAYPSITGGDRTFQRARRVRTDGGEQGILIEDPDV